MSRFKQLSNTKKQLDIVKQYIEVKDYCTQNQRYWANNCLIHKFRLSDRQLEVLSDIVKSATDKRNNVNLNQLSN